MAVDSSARKADDMEQLNSPTSPGADYGLRNSFDPSKYDFYNAAPRRSRKGPTSPPVDQSPNHIKAPKIVQSPNRQSEDRPSSPYLSPIQEHDDDAQSASLNRSALVASLSYQAGLDRTEKDGDEAILPRNSSAECIPLEVVDGLLFSSQHLKLILGDRRLSPEFRTFIKARTPQTVPVFARYINLLKALRSIEYAEAIVKGLEAADEKAFATEIGSVAMPWVIQDKIDSVLVNLVDNELRSFIADIYARIAESALSDRVMGKDNTEAPDIADGLAEVFVLSDPVRPDNPIVFTSDDFQEMTGYSRKEFLGRNCRILGGPKTSLHGIRRFREAVEAGREHCEVLVNYRRNGTAFMNLIMCVPLRDHLGRIRYFLGAQLDITSLMYHYNGLHTLRNLQERHTEESNHSDVQWTIPDRGCRNIFEDLSATFNAKELEHLAALHSIRTGAGALSEGCSSAQNQERAPSSILSVEMDQSTPLGNAAIVPRLLGFYRNYLLVRPYPSLRILFSSPELQATGVAQTPLTRLIGGSTRVREHLTHALEIGRKVTAKVQWLSPTEKGSGLHWIHCTPLLGANDTIGVWMVILIKAEERSSNDDQAVEGNMEQAKANYDAAAIPWEDENLRPKATDNIRHSAGDRGGSGSQMTTHKTADLYDNPTLQSTKPNGKAVASTNASRLTKHKQARSRDSAQKDVIFIPGDTKLLHDDYSLVGTGTRPNSQGSSVSPVREQTQPKMTMPGQSSLANSSTKKSPINLPGLKTGNDGGPDTKPVRKTYKSLSPYGVLFQD